MPKYKSVTLELQQAAELKTDFAAAMAAVAKQIPDTPTRNDIERLTPVMPHLAEAATALKDYRER